MRFKPLLRTIHLWMGIGLCLWAIAVAATGVTLAYRARVESLLHRGLYFASGAPGTPDFDRIVSSVDIRYPDRRILQIHRNGLDPAESLWVDLAPRIDLKHSIPEADLQVFVDPTTGAILGEKPYWDWMRVVYDFHTTLLMPLRGKSYMGLLGIALFVITGSGLIYWWPRGNRFRQALRVTTGRGTRRLLRDLHASGGALIALLLILSTLSGVLMCYEGSIQRELRHLGLAISTAPPRSTNAEPLSAATRFISMQQAVDSALRTYPDNDVVVISPPTAARPRYSLQLFPRHASRIWRTVETQVDAVTGQVVSAFDPQRQPWGNTLVLWLIFFHNGQMFGAIGQGVVLAMGLVLLVLSVSGPWMWLLGRRRSSARPLAQA